MNVQKLTLTERTTYEISETLAGRRSRGLRTALVFTGPAVIASIAYMDPGNFATNIQAGSKHGYSLLWVVLMANLTAMLFQALSAKLGIATSRNLAELCRDQFPRSIVWSMWGISEIAAMATDLAESLGAAIGLSILMHIPLLAGMTLTGVATSAILLVERRGFRPIELTIGYFVVVIAVCYLTEMFIAPVDWGSAFQGTFSPRLPDAGALTISVGIIGATIMPHVVYLHSELMRRRVAGRSDAERDKLLRFSNREVVIALCVAGLVNMAIIVLAASAFHEGHSNVAEIETAYHILTPLLGAGAAGFFLLSLVASGTSSSVVGTMAGQMIMQGFVRVQIPVWIRRLVTMLPAFVVVAIGVNVTDALVMSQVVLSIALPCPLIALVLFTRRPDIMGRYVNGRLTNFLAVMGTGIVVMLNVVLLLQAFGGPE
jgi:manganese transport protein